MRAFISPEDPAAARDPRLRSWPAPELPERPYPLLLPYTHPALMAGRERELAELRERLTWPVSILGLYAPSGTGKSSLLRGGLVPRLRAEGWPVACDAHPHEPRLPRRLIGDLLDEGMWAAASGAPDADYRSFIDLLVEARRLAGAAPILVLDQIEDLLRRAEPDRRRARAVVGALLAATVRLRPGFEEPPCRWLLAYRQELHGEVVTWLRDVLYDARRLELPGAATLPHDLSGADRFHAWQLPPLGALRLRGDRSVDRASFAAQSFLAAIEAPLELAGPDGAPRYPWRFAGDGAARLARAFGEARVARPDAPLLPELQVVLAHLLEQAGEPRRRADGTVEAAVIEVSGAPRSLIDRAMEDHLRRALDAAFAAGRGGPARRQGRTRALLALRELADAAGRRHDGWPAESLARAIGPDGEAILARLSAPQARLVVVEEHPEGPRYALTHDRLAEVVVRLVEEEGRLAEPELLREFHRLLAIDEELLALRRFVAVQVELHRAGETRQSTAVPRARYRRIAAHADALLWSGEQRAWWRACRERRRRDRRRRALGWVAAALVLALAAAAVWMEAGRRARRAALFEQLAAGEPAEALSALARLAADPAVGPGEIRPRLERRRSPEDLLERGLGGAPEAERGALVVTAVEALLPLAEAEEHDVALTAVMAWALDFFPGRDAALAGRARALRAAVLEPLRRRAPPPSGLDDEGWAAVPAGTFQMGTGAGEGRDAAAFANERPRHPVTLSGFRIMTHEVTLEAFRRLFPDHPGDAASRLPAVEVDWYRAYAYAAWLGGRLPTEAEWEYAARAGCPHEHCDRTGAAASLDQVGWHRRNATDPDTGEASLRPVARLEPNPWGLFDMLGNAWEWTADWLGEYPEDAGGDPMGPAAGVERVMRGGGFWIDGRWAHAACRLGRPTRWHDVETGFRVVLPAAEAPGRAGRSRP